MECHVGDPSESEIRKNTGQIYARKRKGMFGPPVGGNETCQEALHSFKYCSGAPNSRNKVTMQAGERVFWCLQRQRLSDTTAATVVRSRF